MSLWEGNRQEARGNRQEGIGDFTCWLRKPDNWNNNIIDADLFCPFGYQ
ncbi:MAG: hypothetical protein HEQ20_02735 [Aphanizomenon flos-aquae KM1D3_PB]|nr:MAG: hypothetical protein HEQ20_02735 [Aphanizomenon flos-aquae KM1D3_PB]